MPRVENCVFCNVDQLRQSLLYESDSCIVILDKYPISKGHVLVVPKEHTETMLVSPNGTVGEMFVISKKVAIVLNEELRPGGLNVTTNIGRAAGQMINHFHIHVIPRYEVFENLAGRTALDGEKELQDKERQALAAALKAALG